MALLDFFSAAAKLRRLGKRVTERYGPPENRQKAILTLSEIGTPEALSTLLLRFTIRSDPTITDAEEKQTVFELMVEAGDKAVQPLKDFVKQQDSVSWAVRIMSELLTPEEVNTIALEELQRLGAEYTRDPEKKIQLIIWLEEHRGPSADARLAPTLIPYLEDMSDDVKIAAARTLVPDKPEAAREPLLQALLTPDQSARVRQALLAALADSEFWVQGYREKVEGLVQEPYFIDKSGVVKRR
jgi:HEAT repeat protein